MLEVRELCSYYGQFQAIHEISLQVEKDEMVVVFGPNGHGKSTLLKTICGLHKARSGSVTFDGADITNLMSVKLVARGLVYIAEDRNLFPKMTVMENLELGAFSKHARPKKAENLEYVLRLFPKLKARINSLAETLSGGEARMLAIGRGLMSNARLLAIDEPSLGLSPKLREEVFQSIHDINKSGMTILMVEQSIAKAYEYTNKIYLVEDGRIVFGGNRAEALSHPHVKEVFLGI
jgi:branched-chain amino acid transport system ATP-binding protein